MSSFLPTAPLEILTVEVGALRFGLVATGIKEILRMVALTALPQAPGIIAGLINVRGLVVPVLDMRVPFSLSRKAPDPADHLVVTWAGDRLVALWVDRAIDLIRLEPADVDNADRLLPGMGALSWVARTADNLILVPDLISLLARGEAETLRHASAATETP